MKPYYQDDLVELRHGDALAVARDLDTASVQTIVTSPPYFGLRDYGTDGQLGAEDTVADYVAGMVSLFHELRRVLADDGTLWLNLGDSYASKPVGTFNGGGNAFAGRDMSGIATSGGFDKSKAAGVPEKNLIGVPWRVALALQADGWILRSDIIWAKPNPMPESVTDRPTKSHEYLFLLAKSPKYYYDAVAIREEARPESAARYAAGYKQFGKGQFECSPVDKRGAKEITPDQLTHLDGRNKRTVWEVPTAPFAGAHFAVYPPELIRPCILAGSRIGDTVLDPFSGSGTTGMVATQEGRKYVGIDLNADYLDLSLRERFAQPPLNFEGIA